jgi:hypothetical protein
MSVSTRLSPMASYYVRRLVQSRKGLLEQVLQDTALLEAALLEPEMFLSRLSLEPLERLQRVNNLEIFARAYQNLSKDSRHPEETKEVEKQILASLGLDQLLDSSVVEVVLSAEAPQALTAGLALEIMQSLLSSGSSYLGPKITGEYWALSRPSKEWLNAFVMNSTHHLLWSGSREAVFTEEEQVDLQIWVKTYIKKCSQIIHGFHEMIDLEKLKPLSIAVQDL